MSNAPPARVMKRAFPPVALSTNAVSPPALVIMVALPALLVPRKKMFAWLPTMPAPVMLIDVVRGEDVAKVYAGAPGLNCSVPIDVVMKGSNNIEVVFDAPKNAVLVGTTAGFQLLAVLKLPEPGLSSQVASCARADVAASNAAAATVLNKYVRISLPPLRNAHRTHASRGSRKLGRVPTLGRNFLRVAKTSQSIGVSAADRGARTRREFAARGEALET